jgi:hypothetical protein
MGCRLCAILHLFDIEYHRGQPSAEDVCYGCLVSISMALLSDVNSSLSRSGFNTVHTVRTHHHRYMTCTKLWQGLVWTYFFDLTVNHFGGDRAVFTSVPWQLNTAIAIYFVTSTSVQVRHDNWSPPQSYVSTIRQGFFTYRVWKLSQLPWLSAAPGVATVARTATGLSIVSLLALQGLPMFLKAHRYLLDVTLALSTFVSLVE